MTNSEAIKYLEALKEKVNNYYAKSIETMVTDNFKVMDAYEAASIKWTQKIDDIISLIKDFPEEKD